MTHSDKNKEIIERISRETGYRPEVIRKIIKWFYLGIRKVMYKNGEINIKGLFVVSLRPFYKKKVKENPDIDLRKREWTANKKRKK